MKYILCTIILLAVVCSVTTAQSERTASITGRVYDKSTQKPMDVATVSVINSQTGKIVTGSLTNSNGEFSIFDIPFGVYNIEATFISYGKVSVDSIRIDKGKETVSLGTIYLSPSDVSLKEVKIISDKPVIENKPDKIVYNVSNDISSQGAQAIDVLRKVPEVTVDADGNVELQGNANVKFLVNGKSSSIFGSNLADALSSIPASQIKSIEAITNPGAKYDAQGTGGIINIILQDNKLHGVSGNFNLSPGTVLENGSANLSAKRNKFGVNAYFGGMWHLKTDGSFNSNRTANDTSTRMSTLLLQNGLNNFERKGFRSGAGFEWDISKTSTLSGSAGYNKFSFSSAGLTDMEQALHDNLGNNISDVFTVRNSNNRRDFNSVDWNLDFKKNFKKEGHDLELSLNSSYGKPVSYYNQSQSLQGGATPFTGSESRNPGTDNRTELSVDYSYPVSKDFNFETGLKGTLQSLTSLADVRVYSPLASDYTFDPLQSYNLKYNMKIFAGYLSTSFRLFNYLDLKPGIRYEFTDVSIDSPNTTIPSYNTFVPSIVLSHNFSRTKSLQLSYSKRIERPDYNDLNPFLNRSDPFNITTGNIFLKPEIGNNIEFSFNNGFKNGGNLRFSLLEHINSREIQNYTTYYPTYVIGDSTYSNVSVTTNRNIGEEYNSGLSLSGSIPVMHNLSLRPNLMVFYTYLVGSQNLGNLATGWRIRGNMNASYELPGDLALEFFGFWRSGARNIQGKTPQFFIYNFALRKRFWNKNGSLGITATNPFGRNIRQVTTINTENSVLSSIRELPFRSFGVSFTYKFGKIEPNKKNQGNTNDTFGTDNNYN